MSGPNHPFVVWGSCFLWLTSMFAIVWALVLFYCIGDVLLITGTDLVIALILLSGIIMLPTNVFMLYTIANGQRIDHKSRVLCCPLWMLMIWIIAVNTVGVALCIQKICVADCMNFISHSMKNYRSILKYKHFMDNLQWSLKCCGLDSYKDWFNYDWYEKIRDYEWEQSHQIKKKLSLDFKRDLSVSDSVPLSCCKSGTCIPNYLLELGTHSIYTKGCLRNMDRIYLTMMNVHLTLFLATVISEIILLTCIISRHEKPAESKMKRFFNVKHIMPINNKFQDSSNCSSMCPEDSDDELRAFQAEKRESQ